MREKASKRAWKMEQRFEMEEGSEIARRYWKEIKERAMRNGERSEWKEERIEFF